MCRWFWFWFGLGTKCYIYCHCLGLVLVTVSFCTARSLNSVRDRVSASLPSQRVVDFSMLFSFRVSISAKHILFLLVVFFSCSSMNKCELIAKYAADEVCVAWWRRGVAFLGAWPPIKHYTNSTVVFFCWLALYSYFLFVGLTSRLKDIWQTD